MKGIDFMRVICKVTNQERPTRFSFSGSPSVIERLGVEMTGGVVSWFMRGELPEAVLAPINCEPHQDWATNPDDVHGGCTKSRGG
jgi:hypothetical protein